MENQTNELSQDNPYASMFWDMIEQARLGKASDIHVQPEKDGVDLRFRVHGELKRWKWVPEIHQSLFLQEAKRLSACSIATSGKPQDSRISLKQKRLDVRVNLIPSLYGEKLVLRLLDQSKSFQLESTGIVGDGIHALRRALSHRTGVSLLTGPTGSGKTTLLYSALSELDRAKLNIVTIEDPIEYTFSGITQVQTSHKLAFSDALRAMLRQDPDVILLGEVRDQATAELCFQAASTGHLVLSTLHANSASEVKQRLHGLGVNPDLVSSCLKFCSAQRLIPKLCPKCKSEPDSQTINRGLCLVGDPTKFRVRNRNGCDSCQEGVVGRVPIFEYQNETFESPRLQQAALELAREGEVDVLEALAVS